MKSIGSIIDQNKGFAPGFDFLRVALSVSVVAWHAVPIASNAGELGTGIFWYPNYAILGAFFGLSGYLITGSATRLSLKNFLINRGLRIFPALIVETVLSAVILGLLFSTLPMGVYLTDPKFAGYFTSIFGYIKYELPGVFESNPIFHVNLSLWTVPYELLCYAIMSALIIAAALKRPWLLVGATAAFMIIGLVVAAMGYTAIHGLSIKRALYAVFAGRASRLIVCFMLGIAAYLYRYRLPYDIRLAALCLGFVGALLLWQPQSFAVQNVLLAPLTVYLTVFLGATNLPKLLFFDRGDYSYGIYLYGAPIQQAVRAAFPKLNAPWENFLVSMPLIVVFAAFSWHIVEEPILKMRKKFSFIARQRGLETSP
jgi:peptidoglycan/LPS O-acetylase OafA/YrhL